VLVRLLLLGLRLRRVRRSGRPALLDPLAIGQGVLHGLELRELATAVAPHAITKTGVGSLRAGSCAIAHGSVDDLRDPFELPEWHPGKCTKPC